MGVLNDGNGDGYAEGGMVSGGGGAAGSLRSAPISELVAEEVGERFSCGCVQDEGLPAAADVTQLIRFSLSCNEAGDIEVFSCETQTMLILPKHDVQLLIDNLKSLDQMRLPRETISLDPSS